MPRSRSVKRLLYLLGAAAASAAAIIGIVVLLTPLEPNGSDPASETAANSAAATPAAGAIVAGSAPGATLPANPPRKIAWPTEPAEVTVEALQAELKRLANRLSERFPERADALHVSAMIAKELGRSAEAEALWQRSVDLAPPQVGPYVGLATALMDRGEGEAAVAVLEKAHAEGRKSAESYRQLAVGQGRQGEIEAAAATLQEALTLYPDESGLWLEQAQVLLQLRKLEQAEESIRRAFQLGEESPSALATLATILARNRKTEEAAKVRAAMADAQPVERSGAPFQDSYRKALRSVAVNCLQLASTVWTLEGDHDQAEKLLMRAIEIAPHELTTYMELARLYRSQRRIADALQTHERLIELQPDNVLNYVNLASIATQLGNLSLAEQTLVQGIKVKPDYAFPYGELAKLHLVQQEFERALERARQANQREPENVEWLLMIAAAAKGAGDNEQAHSAFDAARRLAPEDPRLQSMLAAIPELGQAAP